MKRTRRKNVLRGIRGSLNRFLSILFIVALGSGFMAGLAATSPDMYATADKFMDDCGWYDIDVKSSLGLTGDDVSAIEALDCTETAMPARVMDLELAAGEDSYTARVYATLDDNGGSELNRMTLTEGRYPENSGECVVQTTAGRYFDGELDIGSTLTLLKSGSDYETVRELTAGEELTVVGFVESPMSISVTADASTAGSGAVGLSVYTTGDYFTFDYYTDIYFTLRGARELDTFGEEYSELRTGAVEQTENIAAERERARTDEVRGEAEEQLDRLGAALEAVEDAIAVRRALGEDTAGRLRLNGMAAALLAQSAPELSALLTQTQQAVTEQLQGAQELPALPDTLKKQIADGEKRLDELEDAVWIVRTREDSAGFSAYKSNVGKVAALSKIFPVFFFMVALLVALTTMTRLVEENRGQIGTLKALGFSNGQVLGEYLLYSLLSSALGCALGFGVGFRLFPRAISSAYGMMFTLPQTQTPFRLSIALWVAPVTVGSILLATLWACWSEFCACPARLMQPKAPAAGKRIWLEHIPFVWKRIPFTHKVTCRNLFRYKKRLFMTIIGVAGCSALLVTGFGLRDSINDIVDKQFGELYRYELSVRLSSAGAVNDGGIAAILNDPDKISDWMAFAEETGKLIERGGSEQIHICVPEDASRLGEFIALRDRKTGEAVAAPDDGVVLTEKLCETIGVREGDEVTLEAADGRRGTVRIDGITENYVSSYAYMTAETYERVFGGRPELTTVLCCLPENADPEAETLELMAERRVVHASASQTLRDNFDESIKSIDGVVLVLILAAGLLSMVVLYNLTNVNICERRKELATIRVLGFHRREVERYIFRETNVLSVLGTIVGLFVGIWLHSFVVRTVEVDMVMFGRSIYPLSFVLAFAISMIFTLLVNRVMSRQIRRVDMVEAMKAND